MDFQDSIERLVTARRILVLGSSGSGKTTFTRQVGRILQITPIHLDACFWRPGWVSTPQDQWREVVAGLLQQATWIMDGTYESTLHLRIPAADLLIVLEQSRLTCLWRVLKRKATVDDHHRPDAPSGQRLDADFLRYVWRYPDVTGPFVWECIQKYGPEKPLICLRGSRQIRGFVRQLEQAVPARGERCTAESPPPPPLSRR